MIDLPEDLLTFKFKNFYKWFKTHEKRVIQLQNENKNPRRDNIPLNFIGLGGQGIIIGGHATSTVYKILPYKRENENILQDNRKIINTYPPFYEKYIVKIDDMECMSVGYLSELIHAYIFVIIYIFGLKYPIKDRGFIQSDLLKTIAKLTIDKKHIIWFHKILKESYIPIGLEVSIKSLFDFAVHHLDLFKREEAGLGWVSTLRRAVGDASDYKFHILQSPERIKELSFFAITIGMTSILNYNLALVDIKPDNILIYHWNEGDVRDVHINFGELYHQKTFMPTVMDSYQCRMTHKYMVNDILEYISISNNEHGKYWYTFLHVWVITIFKYAFRSNPKSLFVDAQWEEFIEWIKSIIELCPICAAIPINNVEQFDAYHRTFVVASPSYGIKLIYPTYFKDYLVESKVNPNDYTPGDIKSIISKLHQIMKTR